MTMSVKGQPKGDLLYATVDGEFTLDEATRTFGMVLDMMMVNECTKVLFDGRQIKGEPTAVERFYYAAFASDAVNLLRSDGWLEDRPQFAFVLKEPVLDPLRLGQTVAKKRDMQVKAFDDLNAAMRWLSIVPDDLPFTVGEGKAAGHARK